MARKANDEEMAALTLLVTALRPDWKSVIPSYLAKNGSLLSLEDLCRRSVGAATDPAVKVPSDMLLWEPPLREVGEPGRRQYDVPLEQVVAGPRCGHGAPLGLCALCRAGLAAEDPERRRPPTPADTARWAAKARAEMRKRKAVTGDGSADATQAAG